MFAQHQNSRCRSCAFRNGRHCRVGLRSMLPGEKTSGKTCMRLTYTRSHMTLKALSQRRVATPAPYLVQKERGR
jgi:hypothetical protein